MLTVEQQKAIIRIFEQSLDVEAAARAAFIEQACAGDAQLVAAVAALLRADQQVSVNTRGLHSMLTESPIENLGRVFGNFRLVEHLGSGGMGLVYRGERTDDFSQRAAVKLIRQELRGPASIARFNQERATLARIEHPSIARLIDAGVSSDGRPWYVMEFVAGLPIDEHCRKYQLDLPARLRLIIELCKAVEAAHRLLVVHRDIKPSNVLVTADGTPKLIDFGIAKFLATEADNAGLTRDSGALFTAHYASPEQISGEPVTTAVDVYGLGALAFFLLTGRKNFESATRTDLDYLRVVAQRDPELASAVSGNKALRGDLDNILSKALARNPLERYESAAALAADFDNYLKHRPVMARAPTLVYRAGKFLRRNAVAASLGALLAAASATALAIFIVQAREVAVQRNEAAAQRNEARAAAARAESINEFLTRMLQSADPRVGARDTTVAQVMDNGVSAIRESRDADPAVAISVLQTITSTNESLGRYPQALASSALALELSDKPGQSALTRAVTLGQRGYIFRESGDFKSAEPLLRESLAGIERLRPGGAEHAMALDRLAVLLSNTGREAEAAPLYLKAIAQLRAAGVRDVRLATALNDFGVLQGNAGKFAEAVQLHQEAVDVIVSTMGAEHPVADDTRFSLASALEGAGQVAEAEQIMRHVVANREKALGPRHLDTLWAMATLANNLLTQHRAAAAYPIAVKAEQGLRLTQGKDVPLSLYARAVAGRAACESGSYSTGLAMLDDALRGRRKVLPPGHWLTANSQVQLGACQMYSGKPGDAEKNLLAAIPVLEEKRGADYDRTQDAYRYLVQLYEKNGRKDQAARWRAKLLPAERAK